MNETLPKGWAKTNFAEINLHRSKSIDPRNEPETEYELYSVPSFPTGKPEIVKGKDIGSSKQVVEPRDVLVCKINPRINRVWLVADYSGKPQIASSEWIVMRSVSIISDYLRYQFSGNNFRELICKDVTGVGGSLTRAQPKRVATFPVLIAPLPEQNRITDKLDSLLAKVDACKTRIDKVPKIIKRFRQSVLADAASGKLTEDWRGEDTYDEIEVFEPFIHKVIGPSSWEKDTLFNTCEFIGGSQPPKTTFLYDEQPESIRLIQIRDYKSDDKKVFIPTKLAKRFCTKTDVMIGRYGPPIFQILRGLEGAYNVALMKAVPKQGLLDNDFLFYYLKNPNIFRYVEAGSDRTAGQSGINKKLLIKYPIFIPSLEEQKEITNHVETLFTAADQLEQKLETARKRIDKMTASILSKAFRGELVPQNPKDESAELLLKRIRAEQVALAANKKKDKRKPKNKTARGKRSKPQKADAEVEPEPEAAKLAETYFDKEKDKNDKLSKQITIKAEKRFEKDDILKAFRKAIFHQTDIDEYTLLRLVGQRLGVQRLSKQIRQELESYIRTAIQRKIIIRDGGEFIPATPTVQHFDDDILLKSLCAVINKKYMYQREDLADATAKHLGFDKASNAFNNRMKSIFRKGLRRNILFRNGKYIGKN